MSPLLVALAVAAALLCAEMGASGLSPSFSASLGSGLVGRRRAAALFAAFVLLGAVLFGSRVARTLGGGLVPAPAFDRLTTLAAIASAAIALFAANRLRIPQSTSWVSVAAVVTVGLHHGRVDARLLFGRILPAWILLPLVAFGLTRLLVGRFYPLRASNLRWHEALPRHARALRALTLATSCYVAVAIGANNVAHAVGPLSAAGVFTPGWGLALMAPFFGLGAFLVSGPAEAVGRDIVPVGLLTAAIVNVIVGSLLLTASLFGIPQSLVHLSTACVLAVARVKEGGFDLMDQARIRRIGVVWVASPALAMALTWALLEIVRLLMPSAAAYNALGTEALA
jgi:phosphate/sulfate permease